MSKENETPKRLEHAPAAAALDACAEPQTLYALIARQDFLKGLSQRHLEQLTESALQMQFDAGQKIFEQGNQANRFFLILEGKVVLESEDDAGVIIPIQTLGPGDDLGWSWLFQPHYLHFTAFAAEPTKVLFFYGTRLRQQCEEDHDLGYELMKRVGQVVVQRLEATRQKLSASTGNVRYRD